MKPKDLANLNTDADVPEFPTHVNADKIREERTVFFEEIK